MPRLCSALVHSPGKWVAEILLILGCLVGLWMDVEAFQSIQLSQGPTLDSEALEHVTLPLVRSRGHVFRGARPAGLGEADQPGILPIFGMCSPEIKTHLKLVELVRIK